MAKNIAMELGISKSSVVSIPRRMAKNNTQSVFNMAACCVSIPRRMAKNLDYNGVFKFPDGEFQSLVGWLKTSGEGLESLFPLEFQSLVGWLKTLQALSIVDHISGGFNPS